MDEKKDKKNHSPELISRPEATTASQENDAAKIQKRIETCKANLKKIANIYDGVSSVEGFITNLKLAMGIIPRNVSDYVHFDHYDVSLRISNHNANCSNYRTRQRNSRNISIVVKSRRRTKNSFMPDPEVVLDEYVYMEKDLRNADNPLPQIAKALENFLDTGYYVDTTGLARHNHSPQE